MYIVSSADKGQFGNVALWKKKGCGREWSWPILSYYSTIFLESLSKAMESVILN